jgi:hypothetical protein
MAILATNLYLRGAPCRDVSIPMHFDGSMAILAQKMATRGVAFPSIMNMGIPTPVDAHEARIIMTLKAGFQWNPRQPLFRSI